MDGKWFLSFLSVFLINYERYNIEIRYGGSPCIPFEPFALPLVHGAVSGTLVVYYYQILAKVDGKWGLSFLARISLTMRVTELKFCMKLALRFLLAALPLAMPWWRPIYQI